MYYMQEGSSEDYHTLFLAYSGSTCLTAWVALVTRQTAHDSFEHSKQQIRSVMTILTLYTLHKYLRETT